MVFALAVVLLAALSAIPFGSAGFAASQCVAAAAWLIGGAGLLMPRPHGERVANGRRDCATLGMYAAATLWLGWAFIQWIPLPGAWARRFWHGAEEWLAQTTARSGGWLAIAIHPWLSLHTLWLWAGLFVLAAGCARQLGFHAKNGAPQPCPATRLAVAGLLLGGLIQAILGIFVLPEVEGRLTGTFRNADAFGGVMALLLPLTTGYLLDRLNRKSLRGRTGLRWWSLRLTEHWQTWLLPSLALVWVALWIALCFSGSRGATLAALAGCLAMLVWQAVERPEHRRGLVVAGLVLALFLGIFQIHARKLNVWDRSGGWKDAGQTRAEIWRTTARMFHMFPLGTGAGGTALALPMVQDEGHGTVRLDYAHNDTLQFWGDLGPIGFAGLAVILLLVMVRGARGCRRRLPLPAEDGAPQNPSPAAERAPWILRGIWVGAAVALLHSQVEFNLSARPALQVLFSILCGMLWGSRPSAYDDDAAGDALPAHHHRVARILAWGALATMTAIPLLAARANWILEGCRAAMNLPTDDYLWFRRPLFTPEQLPSALATVSHLAPASPAFHEISARLQLHQHRNAVEATALRLLPTPEKEDPDPAAPIPPTTLDPLLPAHTRLLNTARLALRLEELTCLDTALREVDIALTRSPWDPRLATLRSTILLRASTLRGNPTARADALHDLRLTTALYPAEAIVLADACTALAAASPCSPEELDLLLRWGLQSARLNPTLASDIMDVWWQAGLPPARILDLPALPETLLWRLHAFLAARDDPPSTVRCLRALQTLADAPSDAPSASAPAQAVNRAKIRHVQFQTRLAREWLKFNLRHGDAATIAASAPLRRDLLDRRIQNDLDLLNLHDNRSAAIRRLRLREWEAERRLPPSWSAEWALLELETGARLRPEIEEPLLRALILGTLPPSQRLRLRQSLLPFSSRADFLLRLAAIRDTQDAASPATAATQLDALLKDTDADIPSTCRHRLHILHAQLLDAAGDPSAAHSALSTAHNLCPEDPDTSADLATTADPGLDLSYLGGRLRLLHATLVPPPTRRATNTFLRLQWQYSGGNLPPLLKISVRIHDASSRLIASRILSVEDFFPARYNRGSPLLGLSWTWDVPLPPLAASQGDLLRLSLLNGPKVISPDDALPALLIGRNALRPVPSPANQLDNPPMETDNLLVTSKSKERTQ